MPHIAPDVLDEALGKIKADATRIVACSSYPASYAAVAGVTLGAKSIVDASFSGPSDPASGYGRRLLLSAFEDGTASADGEATYYAIVDDAADIRLAVQVFETPKAITSGVAWGIDEAIEILLPAWPDAA